MWYKKLLKKTMNGIQKTIDYLFGFWEKIRWKTAGRLVYLSFRLIRFSGTLKNLIIKVRHQLTINGDMAKSGSLFFTVSMILLATEKTAETSIWEFVPILNVIPAPPQAFSTILRVVLIVIFLALFLLIPIILQKCRKSNNKKDLFWWISRLIMFILLMFVLWLIPVIPLGLSELVTLSFSAVFLVAVFIKWLGEKLKNITDIGGYWFIFLMVYVIGWMNGLAKVQGNDFAYKSIFWFGTVWFVVIIIIMLVKSATWPPKTQQKT